jgi:serine protease inhibitor ecotin
MGLLSSLLGSIFRPQSMNDYRIAHDLKVAQTMQKMRVEGFKVDRVTEPSTVDILACSLTKKIIRFIEVKAGKSRDLTQNEREFMQLIESNPKLSYEVV